MLPWDVHGVKVSVGYPMAFCCLRALAIVYSKGGGFRLSCWIRLYLLLSCFVAEDEWYDAAESDSVVSRLSTD